MLRLLPAALLLAGTIPAFAAQQPPAASLYHQQDSRSIAIENWSGQPITAARVKTTDGRVWTLAKGAIPQNQAQEIVVPAHDCIGGLAITLKDGRSLIDTGLHECQNTQIVVRANRVTIPRQAVPGGKQHNTPG